MNNANSVRVFVPGTHPWHSVAAQTQCEAAVFAEVLSQDIGTLLLGYAHSLAHHRVLVVDHQRFLDDTFLNLGSVESLLCGSAVGINQAAGAQLDATEVTDHDDTEVGQFETVDLSQYRFARRARRFAVIVATELGPLIAQHIGPTDVSRIEILFLVARHNLLGLFGGAARFGKGQKLAHFLLVQSFGGCSYGEVGVQGLF